MEELKPCPFCGKEKESLRQYYDDKYGYTVACVYCGGKVASHISSKQAINVWNTRQAAREAL